MPFIEIEKAKAGGLASTPDTLILNKSVLLIPREIAEQFAVEDRMTRVSNRPVRSINIDLAYDPESKVLRVRQAGMGGFTASWREGEYNDRFKLNAPVRLWQSGIQKGHYKAQEGGNPTTGFLFQIPGEQ